MPPPKTKLSFITQPNLPPAIKQLLPAIELNPISAAPNAPYLFFARRLVFRIKIEMKIIRLIPLIFFRDLKY
jgi:hypothetical protein